MFIVYFNNAIYYIKLTVLFQTLDETLISNIINRHIYQDDNDVLSGLILTLSSLEQLSLISRMSNEPTSSSTDHPTQDGQLKLLLNATDDLAASSLSFENLKVCCNCSLPTSAFKFNENVELSNSMINWHVVSFCLF